MKSAFRKFHRRSLRLQGYDYSRPGAYFVTICVHGKFCLFGEVIDNAMRFNEYGRIVQSVWHELPDHYAGLHLDSFVCMPNHVHGVLVLDGTNGEHPPMDGMKRHGLPEIIRGFKTFSARQINAAMGCRGEAVWQRNYYERIIRNDRELQHIRRYITNNPARWALDRENQAIQS